MQGLSFLVLLLHLPLYGPSEQTSCLLVTLFWFRIPQGVCSVSLQVLCTASVGSDVTRITFNKKDATEVATTGR